jgi:hypothetical protein
MFYLGGFMKLFEDISNENLLTFTNVLAYAEQRKRATFKGEDLKVTDANRERVLAEAEASARAYAESRNKQGTSPRSSVGATEAEKSIAQGVLEWVARRRVRGHGKR